MYGECLNGDARKSKFRIRGYGDGNYNQVHQKIKDLSAVSKYKSKINEVSNLAQSSVKRRFSVRKMTNSTLEIYRKLLLKKGFSPLVLGK